MPRDNSKVYCGRSSSTWHSWYALSVISLLEQSPETQSCRCLAKLRFLAMHSGGLGRGLRLHTTPIQIVQAGLPDSVETLVSCMSTLCRSPWPEASARPQAAVLAELHLDAQYRSGSLRGRRGCSAAWGVDHQVTDKELELMVHDIWLCGTIVAERMSPELASGNPPAALAPWCLGPGLGICETVDSCGSRLASLSGVNSHRPVHVQLQKEACRAMGPCALWLLRGSSVSTWTAKVGPKPPTRSKSPSFYILLGSRYRVM